MMPSVLDWSSYIKDISVNFLLSVFFALMLFFSFSLSFSQSHSNTSRTDTFQGCSGPTALWARRWVASSSSLPPPPFMTESCAYTALAGRYSHVNRHTCWSTHVHRHIYIPYPLLTSHYCPSYAQIVRIWMTQYGWYAASSWQWHCSTSWRSFCLMMQPEPEIFGCPILPA